MGDVIMLLPVLKGVLESNKDLEIYLLTRKYLFPFFEGIKNLHLLEADLSDRHEGFRGIYRLFQDLKNEINPDEVIDLHQVLRTYLLNFFFKLKGTKVTKFDKGTLEKKIQVKKKSKQQLPNTIDRYQKAFEEIGLKFQLPNAPILKKKIDEENFTQNFGALTKETKLIGIAPFAQHKQKIWGVDKVEKLIVKIQQNYEAKIILFGGGLTEINRLSRLESKFENVFVSAQRYALDEEIGIIGHLDAMISMDSANMHIAALCGTPTISIWGGTHSALGFAPYQQPKENIIEYTGDKIACRPCSVYGNKKCIYNDVRCMNYVEVDQVYNRLREILLSE